jgi:hypothetical protein
VSELDFPCRVSADLDAYESGHSYPDRFDPYLQEHVDAVAPYHFRRAVAELLLLREQLELLDPKTQEAAREGLDLLYRACVDQWNDL